MPILHTVNKSSFTHNVLESCLTVCADEDSILLLEDGVFGALKSAPTSEHLITRAHSGTKVYVLTQDLEARGIKDKIFDFVHKVDYDGFVTLTIRHQCVQSWY